LSGLRPELRCGESDQQLAAADNRSAVDRNLFNEAWDLRVDRNQLPRGKLGGQPLRGLKLLRHHPNHIDLGDGINTLTAVIRGRGPVAAYDHEREKERDPLHRVVPSK
jgi:hypothetical protein